MIFLKGLVHGFDQKLAIIHFRRNRPGKCVSRFSRKKKMPWLTIITRSRESRKIGIFPKGLVHRFGRKVSIFLPFHLSQNRPGKYFSQYSRKKKRLSRLKKEDVIKVEKLGCFHDILKRKRRFFRHLL